MTSKEHGARFEVLLLRTRVGPSVHCSLASLERPTLLPVSGAAEGGDRSTGGFCVRLHFLNILRRTAFTSTPTPKRFGFRVTISFNVARKPLL